MMVMGILYKATCASTNKIYFGITVEGLNKRINKHFYCASKGSTTYFHNALRKYGRDGFAWDILAECDDVELLKLLEVEVIDKYSRMGLGLFNATKGGDGAFGLVHSEETKKKMSASATGRKASPETKAKMSMARKGKPKTPEWIEKIRISNTGKPVNMERAQKSAETRTGMRLSEQHKQNISLGLRAAYDMGKRDRNKQRRPKNGIKQS